LRFLSCERDRVLTAWVAWLDHLGIANTGIRDEQTLFPYSTVVFRAPANIQLELFWSSI
jgi:glyoxylase I family protein